MFLNHIDMELCGVRCSIVFVAIALIVFTVFYLILPVSLFFIVFTVFSSTVNLIKILTHFTMQKFLIYPLFSNNKESYIKNFVFGFIGQYYNRSFSLSVVLHFFAGIQALCLNCILIHLFCFFRFLTAP